MLRTRKKAEGVGGGSKLSRGEILQARINSKQRLALEIMARLERRTISSFIEGLIEKAAKEIEVDVIPMEQASIEMVLPAKHPTSIKELVEKVVKRIWHVEEGDRFVAFAMSFPELLNEYEEKLWFYIRSSPYFWTHFRIEVKNKQGKKLKDQWWPINEHVSLLSQHLREAWPTLVDVASGKKPVNALAKYSEIGKKVEKPEHYPDLSQILGDNNERKV